MEKQIEIMIGKIKQYRPAFFTGFEDAEAEFKSVEELLAIKWVRRSTNQYDFYQFSISKDEYGGDRLTLMAEFDEGRVWYVIGFIEATDIVKNMPNWKPKEK